MNAKYLVAGTLILGVVIFMWGAVTHALLPQPLHTFTNGDAVVAAMRANAPGNGVFLEEHGVFAAISFRPDFSDKSQDLKPDLIFQFITDTAGSLLLLLFVAHISGSLWARAGWSAVAGLAAFSLKIMPYHTWYGFSHAFIHQELLDLVGKFFIGGLLASFLWKKWGSTSS
jgi:hypothetical protein|nr:hypothetical protein [Candidatus Acidoferrales bacterium]